MGCSKCSTNYQFGDDDERTAGPPLQGTEVSSAPTATMHVAPAPPGGPSQSSRRGPAPAARHPSWLPHPTNTTQSEEEAARERATAKPSRRRHSNGYLCRSRCAWSSLLTPLGKQPPRAQPLPDAWGPLWPPSFLLPDNTRDTKWWQQIRQHSVARRPEAASWLEPGCHRERSWLPALTAHRRKRRESIYFHTTETTLGWLFIC